MIKTRFILVLLSLVFSVYAQEERPKIGLVLSGGGAKGLAHIGVLKVLEEEGIFPDYITGTSMGSIIGGLYAIGYTPHELDSIVRNVNWSRLLSDDIPLSSVSPHEKTDYNRYQAEFTITRDGLKIPSGLIRGQQINALITGLSWHVADRQDFNAFPIPFRCVAADLKSGNQYIFKEGDLTTALRASMSIPTVFSPVRKDSMLLVDGGVLNNYPVKICKEMGADIIIGVNVSFIDGSGDEELRTFADILMASATIAGNTSMRDAIKNTDLLISPDMSEYNTGSFSDASKIIQRGEESARQKMAEIRAWKDSVIPRSRDSLHLKQSRNHEIRVRQIRVNGLHNINQQYLLGNIGIQPGDLITPGFMADGLERAMGTRHFENITYQLEPVEDGYLLNLEVEESPKAKVKFSIHYDNEYKAGLLSNVTIRNFFGKTSRTSLTTDISETPRLTLSQINFIGEKQVNAARIRFAYEDNNLPVYLGNGSKYGSFKQQNTTLQAGLMTAPGTNWQMDGYVRYVRSTLQNRSGFSDIFYAGVEHFGNSFLSADFDFIYNSIDSRYFSVKGTEVDLNYSFKFDIQKLYKGSNEGTELVDPLTNIANEKYFTVAANYRKYFSFNRKFTGGLRLSGQFSNQSPPFLGHTFIGGLPFNNRSNEVHFIGYSFREKVVQDFGLAEINLRYRVLDQVHINAMGSVLFSNTNLPEVIEPIGLDKNERVFGYGLIVAYDSFLGPLQVGAGNNSTDSRLRWHFNFGVNF